MGLGLSHLLFVACVAMAVGWFAVRKLAPAWRKPLLPVFAGFTGGLFLAIAYLVSGLKIVLWLAIPVAVIIYFNMTGRRRR